MHLRVLLEIVADGCDVYFGMVCMADPPLNMTMCPIMREITRTPYRIQRTSHIAPERSHDSEGSCSPRKVLRVPVCLAQIASLAVVGGARDHIDARQGDDRDQGKRAEGS